MKGAEEGGNGVTIGTIRLCPRGLQITRKPLTMFGLPAVISQPEYLKHKPARYFVVLSVENLWFLF
jgi:hypothetical protein